MFMTELTDFLCNVYLPILIPGVTAVFMLNVNLLSQSASHQNPPTPTKKGKFTYLN